MDSQDQSGASRPFFALIATAEAIGAGRGIPAVIEMYNAWIEAQPPGAADLHCAWFNLGTELGNAGDHESAMNAYRQAVALHPQFAPAAINLGLLLERFGRQSEALQVWSVAVQPDDSRTALLNQQARLLEQMGQLSAALNLLHTSLLTQHRQPDAVHHWVHLKQKLCQWPILDDSIPGLSRFDMVAQSGPLAALAMTDDVQAQRAIAAHWVAAKTQPQPALAPPEGYAHDRIRVGYLSSDFCSHAMCYLITELFERHDRDRFEVYGYCATLEDNSPIRARVIAAFDHFTRIREISDEEAAHQIRADEIDILIDLNGLTSGGRLQILRWKPAPVQATYLGFIGPVPIPELDYMLCDDFVVPAAIAAAYQPAPLMIEGLYQANDSKRVIAAPMTRSQVGLPDGRFVFCCFSNHYKITETMFGGWMDILRQTGDAVLWLVDDDQWSRETLRARALTAGVDPSRLLFAGRVDPASYMARLAVADLFLDTFPYNAGTIASDAIRMGLPLLTLAGRSFASRMAARMLHAIGAEAGVTESLDAYVATAIGLATNPDRQAAYRALFTESAWAASLGDIAGFTRRFENALGRVVLRAPEAALAAAE